MIYWCTTECHDEAFFEGLGGLVEHFFQNRPCFMLNIAV